MTLNQMMYFKTLAEVGHMGQAAERLLISQPSLSVSLAKLEEELGLFLFERKGHRMLLTPEGAAYLNHVRRILREVEEAASHMKRLAARQENMVRIGCIEPLFYGYLPRMMRCFLEEEENRKVQFELSTDHTDELVRKMKNGLYDVLLCSESQDEELVQVPIISENMVLITPEDRSKGAGSWKELARLPLVGYESSCAMDSILEKMGREQGVKLNFRYRGPTETAITSLVEHGFGCAVLPWSDALLNSYRVRRFPLPGGDYRREIYLTTLKRQVHRGACQRLVEFFHGEKWTGRNDAERKDTLFHQDGI